MKRYKVRITDNNGFHKEYPDGTAIGGSYGEPIVVNLLLNKDEYDALVFYMNQVDESRHYVAVFNLSQSLILSDWHKRVMCEKFKSLTDQVTIKLL